MTHVTFNFSPPTQRADGAALPASEIASYKLERSQTLGGTYGLYNTFAAGTPVTFDMAETDNVFYWRISTVDTGGRVSVPTTPVQVPYQAPPVPANPNPPSGVSIAYS